MFNMIHKYIIVGVIFVTIVSLQQIKILNLQSSLNSWQEKANYELKAKSECLASLNSQNSLIAQFKSDNEELHKKYKIALDNLTKQLSDRKTEIVEVIKKDPSCEKQLQLIIEDQKRFLNDV